MTTGKSFDWYCSSWDIEEHKRAEEALRESQHRLRLIIDTVPALIWLAKPDGSVSYSNRQMVDYFGVADENLRSRGFTPCTRMSCRRRVARMASCRGGWSVL